MGGRMANALPKAVEARKWRCISGPRAMLDQKGSAPTAADPTLLLIGCRFVGLFVGLFVCLLAFLLLLALLFAFLFVFLFVFLLVSRILGSPFAALGRLAPGAGGVQRTAGQKTQNQQGTKQFAQHNPTPLRSKRKENGFQPVAEITVRLIFQKAVFWAFLEGRSVKTPMRAGIPDETTNPDKSSGVGHFF